MGLIQYFGFVSFWLAFSFCRLLLIFPLAAVGDFEILIFLRLGQGC